MAGKIKQYQSSDTIYRPADESVLGLPKNLVGTYIDPVKWAYSTLPPGDHIDLICIHTVNQGKYQGREMVRQRIWLHDILDDEDIPYRVVIKGYWATRKKYAEDQFIYVEKKHRKKATRLINEFNNRKNEIFEIEENESAPETFVNGMLQKKCPSCGAEIDFDYQKCPHCKENTE